MIKKEELIKQCRYYGGENECPYKDDDRLRWFWDMERVWVSHGGVFEGEKSYYESIGGKKYSGIPYDLLIVMFTSWGKTAYDLKNSIESFYRIVGTYLMIANDHYPEDIIPS